MAVKTLDNKAAGDVKLADTVFGAAPRVDIVARVVKWQLAKRRAGAHKACKPTDIAQGILKSGKVMQVLQRRWSLLGRINIQCLNRRAACSKMNAIATYVYGSVWIAAMQCELFGGCFDGAFNQFFWK